MDELFSISHILGFAALSFIITMAWTPALEHFLFKYRLGKQIRTEGVPIFAKLHRKKEGTPTMGGILIWGTTLVLALLFWWLAKIAPDTIFGKLNFLSRGQTLLPLGALVASALVGLIDDLLGVFKIGPKGGGLQLRHRLLIYTIIAAFGAWWFFWKLEWDLIHIPFVGDFNIGWWYIPLFVFILVATAFSVNEADGLDGLAGGVLLVAFGAFAVIAFTQGRMDLAVFCGVIIGALLAFLWFNIHPARFFMGDTGAMPLGITLGIMAMLTNAFLLLPLIGFILVLESGSVILQILSKKIIGRKIFLSAPLHHHLEAKGWPETKVTERFWIIAGVTAAAGLILVLVEKIV
ncbi:MAG: phospho-N-acetylmuramoyl-pentapeptide-transferase [Candidatus Portnoybacteria bacterium RIFCSPLOWO2_01_FULL_43_11]|uniref:Phospho-N-acetylmuramoyl-pentapeptide-transferase n=3 Tax=Candidatus Portnoyibacteriota TaxID=1817913 RepID=A0A1G2FA62_9BACT|nr:MAG: phospho-N-acetylmuramoyl-pentapeptide-transferase [Candidatus Portnoybacteria bacterium RIFCSPHIGHO2_01_FULL_40_12b]OGZ36418.1 MAG: phospho-N-acetylmuramoyl-pentapeptide-transferase [Candidatus Portnoybacteria bacterium RIFCSPHIGHO2_02_FULL_40_23]OGZ39025.1 MAG: phospho-N-acetylmuramoyl-pentapeptide-transferase [Candidatus Portnoybacteria bacterium RIFCSPLOWO2_01_FULL_43_11]OGZ40049.1 MAG: phospho-N-acetylmuramoyl-pentapeptide-transferase [Candidatus Portnoybacteria bacterium RIFCSPLOWO2